jgi:predicted hotdog family 3-hydroxylacyl-ACP dehydratase
VTDISSLLPHAGTARMIERVVSWDEEQILAVTSRHRAADNPLRRDGRLAAVHLAEFAAQVMAIHGGLRNAAEGRPPQPALLVSVRDVVTSRDYIDDLPGEIEITAHALLVNPASWQYSFVATHAGATVATGRVAAIAQGMAQDPDQA